MAHIYRCSKCRTRNTFKHSVGWYTVPRKCRDCGYTKFYVDKERVYRSVCGCTGAYFWGKHRIGAAYCQQNPMWEYNRAVRDGAHPGEIAWEGLGLKLVTGDVIPF